MAPVPPETAMRIRVSQSGPRGTHRMLFHGRTAIQLSTMQIAVEEVLAEMAECCYAGTSFFGAEYSTPGQTFFTPIPSWTPIDAPNTFFPTNADPSGTYGCFVGRSPSTGVRKRLYLYNFGFTLTNDMRYEAGEQLAIDDVITALTANSDYLGAIDGTFITWKNYCNVGVNDYWTRRDRVNA